MTETIDTAALATRFADAISAQADMVESTGGGRVPPPDLTPAEARALAALLRGVVDGPKVKPLEWAHDGTIWWCYDRITNQRYGARSEAQKIAEDKRRADLILSVLPSPPLSTTKEG